MPVQVAMPGPTAQPVLCTPKQAFGRAGGMLLSAGVTIVVHNLGVFSNIVRSVRHSDACTRAGQRWALTVS